MNLFEQLASLSTEARNPRTADIDRLPARDIIQRLHEEDRTVADAVGLVLDDVTAAAEAVAAAIRTGGRLIYVGAGTSGRLGILDASECPPTYGTDPATIVGVIAGGPAAVFRSQEGAEDRPADGAAAMADLGVSSSDVICGIAASGRTPYVIGALHEAGNRGATTVMVATNARDAVGAMVPFVDILICAVVGPEAITGSTRMKSGTAQKMILNMITTTAMVLLGKTFGNVMVDLQPTNEKLRLRAQRTVMDATACTHDEAIRALDQAHDHVKTAIVMVRRSCSADEARALLDLAGGRVAAALDLPAPPSAP